MKTPNYLHNVKVNTTGICVTFSNIKCSEIIWWYNQFCSKNNIIALKLPIDIYTYINLHSMKHFCMRIPHETARQYYKIVASLEGTRHFVNSKGITLDLFL